MMYYLMPQYKWEIYGWHWEITPRVAETLELLHDAGIVFDIWNSPQISAVEWLIDGKIAIPKETFLKPEGEELFFRIAGLYELAASGGVIGLGELQVAIESLGQAEKSARAALQKIKKVPDGAREFYFSECITTPLEMSVVGMKKQIKRYEGLRQLHADTYLKLRGYEMPKGRKRPPQILRDIATINAADIYLNFAGEQPKPGNRKSFKTFLNLFVDGLPGLSDKSMDEHAKLVTKEGGYKGTPISEIMQRHPSHPTK
ncbi:hypothetical protein P1J78_19810 [Psychromarinibacter sp. C21-152]|uniref:Uncharacterized protein n=1 Tax=Psychromarinibacter sediminicola TaxID=3033385 RepID=A0AAE3NVR1_9RHOB|nr:hypothetical protein [Psychromarinibacter sediminicola]MDF0602996.1 hypothetical protein [Psychromarinibacter sediminicola]